jgi:hypothetical protein
MGGKRRPRMTAEQWDSTPDPRILLEVLHGRATERKLRLFACACCRQPSLFDWMTPSDAAALEVAERFADGEASLDQLRAAAKAADSLGPIRCCDEAAAAAVRQWVAWVRMRAAWDRSCLGLGVTLVRCLFANPLRPAPALSAGLLGWHGGLLVSTAQRMYETRDFSELPVLADMLEDAGCTDAQILGHCRGPGLHARGCFVIDAVRSVD